MRQLTTLVFSFARRVKKASDMQLPQQVLSSKQPIQSVDQQLQQQIIPFTASQAEPQSFRNFQQNIKEKLVKELRPKYGQSVQENNTEKDHMLNIMDEDFNNHRLVNRPNKGVVWGLGGQLMAADRKVHLRGVKADIDDILQFLELHQVKYVYLHDFYETNPDTNKRRYAIIGSCFSAKHCWKTGLELKSAFNMHSSVKFHKRSKKFDPIGAFLNGSKNQEWSMVEYKDYQVNLMTEQQRQASDLQWKWNNPVSEQRLDKYNKLKLQKGRKNQFQDL